MDSRGRASDMYQWKRHIPCRRRVAGGGSTRQGSQGVTQGDGNGHQIVQRKEVSMLGSGLLSLGKGQLRAGGGRVLKGRPVSAASQAPGIVSLSPDGIATAVAPGAAQIQVTSGGKTTTASITVLPAAGPVAECDTPKPGWLWCDDFEQDRLDQY